MRQKREKIKLSKDSYKKAKSFLSFIRPYRGTYFIGFIFLIFSSIVSVTIPYLLGKLLGMDKVEISGDWNFGDLNHIYGVLLLIGIALPFQAVLSFFRIYLFSKVTESALKDIRNKAFSKLIHFPVSYYDSNKVGEITSRIATDTNLLQETLTTTIAEFIRQFLTIIIGFSLIIYASPQLSLTMLMVIPVAAISAVFFGKFIRSLSKETQNEAAISNNILEETLMGIKNIKAYTRELFVLNNYQNSTLKIQKLAIKAALWRGLFVGFILLVMFGSVVFIIWRGIELVNLGPDNGGIDNESFFQFILMTVLLGASIGAVPDLFAKIQKSIGATESLMDILAGKVEEEKKDAIRGIHLSGKVEFKNVAFSYPSRPDIEVLKNVSFDIQPGQQLAIVGGSGSGKTTIGSLLLQFYTPNSGDIFLDNINSSDISLETIRKHIAYVPQDVLLTSGTILENILFGNENATIEDVKVAAQKANAMEFINKFPDGLQTVVGDRGIQLSGGQRQRIAIARAILKNPVILILDEATSALDNESESLVQEALDVLMQGRTSVVIAHRLSTIKNANQIIVLEDGEVVEKGTHDELWNKENGRYKQLNILNNKKPH
jgi:ABC-type multidrug transport system fused ATPase/permease subunit